MFKAPTIEYVVDPHVLTHHAVEYEMKTAAAPENAIADSRKVRFSAGLLVSSDPHLSSRQAWKGHTNSLRNSLETSLRPKVRT